MNSMTGFGSARGEDPALGVGLRVEISSINRKQFELKCALAHEISIFENEIRMLVSKKISRGSLLLRAAIVPCGGEKDSALSMAERVCRLAADLQKKCGLPSISDAVAILSLPSVAGCADTAFSGPDMEKLVLDVTSRAIEDLLQMRAAEGARLRPDLEARLAILEEDLKQIEPLVRSLPEQQYAKLIARANEAGFKTETDDERFLRELVIFTDKCDVTEEIVRLKSHFVHFRDLLGKTGEPAGRPLDFLTQEIFREINTLGNKAPVPEVSRRIVSMKTETEKIREQVQNVE